VRQEEEDGLKKRRQNFGNSSLNTEMLKVSLTS
jgi:hypothetical protein